MKLKQKNGLTILSLALLTLPKIVLALDPVDLSGDNKLSVSSLRNFVINVIPAFLAWAAGPVFLLYFLWSAMKYLLSAASPDAVGDAKNGMLFAAIGLAVVALSFAVIKFAEKILS